MSGCACCAMSRYLPPFQKAKTFFALNSKPNGPVSLFTTVFRHSVKSLPAVCCNDGNDGRGLNLEKAGLSFSSFNAMPAKITKK